MEPHLGIVKVAEFASLVMADIPGLIEGASEGRGLGHQFLRHIERTRLLLFMIPADSEDPVAELDMLQTELAKYSPALAEKPRLIARSKTDLIEEETLPFPQADVEFSAATRSGLTELIRVLWHKLETMPKAVMPTKDEEADG